METPDQNRTHSSRVSQYLRGIHTPSPSPSMKRSFLHLHQEQQQQSPSRTSNSVKPGTPTRPSTLASENDPHTPTAALTTPTVGTPLTPQYSSPMFRRYELMTEYANLSLPNHCPPGVYVIPSPDDIHEWYGVLFVHDGPYEGATFKFVLSIPANYPCVAPKVTFLTDMFHPLVGLDGEFSLGQRFTDWTPHTHYIYHILYYIRHMFKRSALKNIEEKHAFNKKAYQMFHHEPLVFTRLANQCAVLSSSESVLYEQPSSRNPIHFSTMSDSQLQAWRDHLSRSTDFPEVELRAVEKPSGGGGLKNLANNFNRLMNS
ncbi:hypothetical protein IWQ61_007074 [Dispira simplex]|nr:hypothetical protein IWQ61_007074 [Dispira simplex]